ncbi:SLBB domain-containing protein [Membranicola marinus]|uniref:SLBB domain-containing protein n=1 Tax=Membranihabitans marinus TaxID=1227546 RepID=A0A953HQV1_9BACT|nr:SLBB domain-containing protein [Membranihabitans marinus]MBY5956631.1 SLBB domain-containing protein [Membranihabitans marinus]
MKLTNILFILFLCFSTALQLQAQDIPKQSEELARQEAESRGLDWEEVKNRMKTRGFDLDNLKPEQLPEAETALQEVVQEMEKEKAAQADTTGAEDKITKTEQAAAIEVVKEKSEDIQEKVDAGASVQEAISETTSEELQNKKTEITNIYGHNVFAGSELSLYRTTEKAQAPAQYVLGTGDKVRISIFGPSQADFEMTIAEDGSISPTGMPKIFLKGITLEKARTLLENRFRNSYTFRPEQFSVVLTTARTITINIFGEVAQPGSYTISALNTAFNALVACKGPTANGSVRNIKLMKDNNEVRELDVYEFLTNPTIRFDFPLNNNDMIYVPFSEKVVTISGAVKRPMMYELKKEEGLKDLLRFAGGLSSNAYTTLIRVNRQMESERQIMEVNLQEILDNDREFGLENGDIITIGTVPSPLKSYVSIEGSVIFPGNYSTVENKTISDVLKKARLQDQARRDLAFVIRTNLDNTVKMIRINPQAILNGNEEDIALQPRDRITIYDQSRFTDPNNTVQISGAVRVPVTETFNPQNNIRLNDLITLAGGLRPNATGKGMLTRINPRDSKDRIYIPVDLRHAQDDPNGASNITLHAGDQIRVYQTEDYREQYSVKIEGLVRDTGTYVYDPSLTFPDLIRDAGGLRPSANQYGMLVRRDTTNSKMREYQLIDIHALMTGADTLQIRPGDVFRIYNKETFINQFNIRVLGAVNDPGSFIFDPSLSVEDALLMGGGLQFDADPKRVDVYRIQFAANGQPNTIVKSIELNADGSLINPTDADFRFEPFDVIVVRTIPDFQLQQVVQINGRVRYPGPYVLMGGPEKLTDLVHRAGGLSADAFPEGATLVRTQGNITGIVVISLGKALDKSSHPTNLVLREGDVISIPRQDDLVSIRTVATKATEILRDTLIQQNFINVNYSGKKSAAWYIRNYAGGFDRNADKKSVRVVYPNGRIKGTNSFWFIKSYPKVRRGSQIYVAMTPPEIIEDKREQKKEKSKEPVKWDELLRVAMSSAAILSSLATTIVLINKID